MCGVIGIASTVPAPDVDWLITGRDTMHHRGPDSKGLWQSADRRVAIGHRRLAVIDLSSEAAQPMLSANKNVVVAFNGEIYNFRELRNELSLSGRSFTTDSDTEVILAAYEEWGKAFVGKLNGMFAISLYDIQSRRLFLMRDRAGEKPLFYADSGSAIQFSSELKGLFSDMRLPLSIDENGLDSYLKLGYVPGESCILKGFKKLPPAHILEYSLISGKTTIEQFWSIPDLVDRGETLEELLAEYERLMRASVTRQLTADVPVGVLLSGGIDSSLITAFAASARTNLKTFNVKFQGYDEFDESSHAQLIAKHFSTDHYELEAGKVEPSILHSLARQFDEPLADSSMIPTYLVTQLVREHCTVALGGDGGDELFGGYHHYSRLLRLYRMARYVPRALRHIIGDVSKYALPVGYKGREWLGNIGWDTQYSLPSTATLFDRKCREELMDYSTKPWKDAETLFEERMPISKETLQRVTRMDFQNYLPDDILVKVDRSSMLNSLEVRAPFLDKNVLEFAYGKVPSQLKATHLDKKIFLKAAAKKLLPQDFDRQRKQGFSIPLKEWLTEGSFRNMFYEVLCDSACLFEKKAVLKLFKDQERGCNNSERLFSLVIFELWRNEYSISL